MGIYAVEKADYAELRRDKCESITKLKVRCPFCGHEQKVQYAPDAKCRGVFFKCQARHCKKEFEIKINQDK